MFSAVTVRHDITILVDLAKSEAREGIRVLTLSGLVLHDVDLLDVTIGSKGLPELRISARLGDHSDEELGIGALLLTLPRYIRSVTLLIISFLVKKKISFLVGSHRTTGIAWQGLSPVPWRTKAGWDWPFPEWYACRGDP